MAGEKIIFLKCEYDPERNIAAYRFPVAHRRLPFRHLFDEPHCLFIAAAAHSLPHMNIADAAIFIHLEDQLNSSGDTALLREPRIF